MRAYVDTHVPGCGKSRVLIDVDHVVESVVEFVGHVLNLDLFPHNIVLKKKNIKVYKIIHQENNFIHLMIVNSLLHDYLNYILFAGWQ